MLNPVLLSELTERKPALEALCRQYGVARLELFGSGTTGDWRSDTSDVDLIVTFMPDGAHSLADRYLGLARDLETLLGRRVDLLTDRSIRNPYFRRGVDATRAVLYAA